MIFIFEGMDNCLKDTIIHKLRGILAPQTQIVKFSNPPEIISDVEHYQKALFIDMFDLIQASTRRNLILNRAHIGEYVYAPIYRDYEPSWIFELESEYGKNEINFRTTLLILLYDSNDDQLILREDGNSFSEGRKQMLGKERRLFLEAFEKSNLTNKISFDLSSFYTERKVDDIYQVDTGKILEVIKHNILSLKSSAN